MEVIFRIKRFDGGSSYWDEFKVPINMTVLEALFYIKENIDSTLAFRAFCRMGICGSCVIRINKKPMLACETQISKLEKETIELEPLKNFNVIKDLVTDFEGFFKKQKLAKPYLIRKSKGEIQQTPKQLEEYYKYTLCIKCGACVSACPVAKRCLGPAPVVAAHRFNRDSRDEGKEERLKALSDHIWHCHFVSDCSEVCPKNLHPAEVIQKVRLEVLKFNLGW